MHPLVCHSVFYISGTFNRTGVVSFWWLHDWVQGNAIFLTHLYYTYEV